MEPPPPDIQQQPPAGDSEEQFRFESHNIRGLAQKLHTLLGTNVDLYALQETDVAEYDIGRLCVAAVDKGYQLLFGDTVNMAKVGGVRMGRRTALLCKGPAAPMKTTALDDAVCQQLLVTGRWIEALVPLKQGYGHILAASAYGYSGASSGGEEYNLNEMLAANMVARAAQRPRVP